MCVLRWLSTVVVLGLVMLDPQAQEDGGVTEGSPHDSSGAWPDSCVHGCQCSAGWSSAMSGLERHTVDCSGEGLRALSAGSANLHHTLELLVLDNNHLELDGLGTQLEVMSSLKELDLSSNHLYKLGGLHRPLPSLRYLSLDHNLLDYLGNSSLWWAPGLLYLSLADNKLEMMHKDAFSTLSQLHTLNLSHNRLFSLNTQWFHHVRTLQRLLLNSNNLHVLRGSVFSDLTSLKHLDLSSNQISHIYPGAFRGLPRLEELLLQANHLKQVPHEALQQLPAISLINLDANHLERLSPGDFENSSVSILKLNELGMLRLVEEAAFRSLPHLVHLEMSNNKQLRYVDRGTFVATPSLNTLYLHNNNLSTVEREIAASLPSLSMLSVRGNPLVCDCVAAWLTTTNVSVLDLAQAVCASPPSKRGRALSEPSLHHGLPSTCAPRLVPLFEHTYGPVLGDTLELDCRAVGIPLPHTEWLVSTGQGMVVLKSSTATAGHRQVLPSGTLLIHYVQGTDHGQYTCLSSNPHGRDEHTATVTVQNMQAQILIMGVSSTAITMTWKNLRYDHDYLILYRMSQSNLTYQSTEIKPYMRTFTASELQPATSYEICIAVKHKSVSIHINCTSMVTRSRAFEHIGVRDMRGYIIGGSVGCLIMLVTLLCTVTYFLHRYNKRRKAQEVLLTDNLSQLFLASMDSMSDTTPITYENTAAAAHMFDEDDLEEIRSTASMTTPTTTTLNC